MKKLTLLLTTLLLVFGLTGCKEAGSGGETTDSQIDNPTVKTYINCNISFSHNIEGTELVSSNEFEINEDIYAIVEFDFYNLDSVDDVVAFKINLTPGIDTYSVYDCPLGPQEPTKVDTEAQTINEDGIIKTIEISGMRFPLKSENAKKHYLYVFAIQASRPCDACYLKATFIPEDGFFNGGRNKSETAHYSFIDSTQTEGGDE